MSKTKISVFIEEELLQFIYFQYMTNNKTIEEVIEEALKLLKNDVESYDEFSKWCDEKQRGEE